MDILGYTDDDERLREVSGFVDDSDHLVSFLYELMRDYVSPGKIEKVIRTSS